MVIKTKRKPQNLVYGLHAVTALLLNKPEHVIEVFLQQNRGDTRLQTILQLAKQHKIAVHFISLHKLHALVNGEVHQGVVARVKRIQQYVEKDLAELLDNLTVPAFLLILDGIQDPHNLGACLRAADAAGVHAVIAPKDRAVSLTPIVHKVASGAAEVIPFIQVTNLARTMHNLKERGIWLMGAAGEAKDNLFKANLSGAIAIVMGAEGKGLRRLTKEHCDQLLHIPMLGSVSSLNVAVATGIFLFEVVRQNLSI
jgi:23S rRNA (guanosine2251-2'-O)-methyltransferase